VPENGVGLAVIQVQPSPPVPLPLAPAGSASSNQTAVLAAVLLTVTLMTDAVAVLPARSRATALRVCGPFAAAVESHVTENGAARSSPPRCRAVELELHADDADVVGGVGGDVTAAPETVEARWRAR